jgi:predicted metal-dependent peptidase
MSAGMRAWLREFVHKPEFLRSYRYYAAILTRLDPIEDPGVPVMAVSAHGRRFYLHVNVDYFLRPENVKYISGVLLHEVHHVVLGHLGNEKFRGQSHPDLMEQAMEISANEYIREPLPGHPPRSQDYRQYGNGRGQSTLERYEKLVEARRQGAAIGLGPCVDWHLPDGVGGVWPGAGDPEPGAYLRVRQLIHDAVEEVRKANPSQGGLLAGRDPGRLLEELPEPEPAGFTPMDWKTALAMFVAQVRARRTTYQRPNRRFPSLVGVIPGRSYSSSRADPIEMVVAIDTSGSMSTRELTEIAGQLRALGKMVELTVVECDVVIHRVYRFEGRLDDVAGRGGTDLRPVFQPEFLREHRPEGIIYFTDGIGPYPEENPGVRTLWVLTKAQPFTCPWGKQTVMRRGES